MNQNMVGYTHEQPEASSTWIVVHGLNCKPTVQVYINFDGKLQRVIPLSIVADSNIQTTITFTSNQSGTAVFQ